LIPLTSRFVLAGFVTTAVSYVLFMGMLDAGWNRAVAASASWAGSLLVGFAINRRFTFGIAGRARLGRQFFLFVLGALLQLLLAVVAYELLIGRLGWQPTLSFICVLVLTTAFSFIWLKVIAFGSARGLWPLPQGSSNNGDTE
jgi:putative flippase GtrA